VDEPFRNFLGVSVMLWDAKSVLSVLYECCVDLIPRIIANTGEGRKNVSPSLSLCMPPDTAFVPHSLYVRSATYLMCLSCLSWLQVAACMVRVRVRCAA
jgi:hypothetical protein